MIMSLRIMLVWQKVGIKYFLILAGTDHFAPFDGTRRGYHPVAFGP